MDPRLGHTPHRGYAGHGAERAGPQSETGRWIHVSDTCLTEVTLDTVLSAQAHMLFYGWIMQAAVIVSDRDVERCDGGRH